MSTYCHTLSLHDALPIFIGGAAGRLGHRRHQFGRPGPIGGGAKRARRRLIVGLDRIDRQPVAEVEPAVVPPDMVGVGARRSEEHTSELQSLMRIAYAVFYLKKKKITTHKQAHTKT